MLNISSGYLFALNIVLELKLTHMDNFNFFYDDNEVFISLNLKIIGIKKIFKLKRKNKT